MSRPGYIQRNIIRENRSPHPAGYYTPSVRELEPELEHDDPDDWPAHFAREGAELGLHTLHLD